MFNDSYNCTKCLAQRGMVENTRRYKGCFGHTPINYSIENIVFNTCPGNYTTPWIYHVLGLYKSYESNIGVSELLELPYKYMQIFGIISNIKEKYRKKEEQRGKRNKGRNNR